MAGAAISTSRPHGFWCSPGSSTSSRACSTATSARICSPRPPIAIGVHSVRYSRNICAGRRPIRQMEAPTTSYSAPHISSLSSSCSPLSSGPASRSHLPSTPQYRPPSIFSVAANPRALCISSSPGFLVFFLIVHVAMIALAGFWSRMRAMITGRANVPSERP